MVTTTDTPDGERIARVETRLENLEQQIVEIRQDIRELRQEMLQIAQSILDEMRDIRNRMDKQFLWILGVMFTMWISLFVLIATFMIAVINKLS